MCDVKYVLPLVFPESVNSKGEADHFLSPFRRCMEVEQHSDPEVAIDMGNPVDEPVVGHDLLIGLW